MFSSLVSHPNTGGGPLERKKGSSHCISPAYTQTRERLDSQLALH